MRTVNFQFLLILFILIFPLFNCFPNKSSTATEVNIEGFKKGDYNHSFFQSTSRGKVNFNVYLPPNWSMENASEYPLMLLLHGQGGDEYSFLSTFPKSDLNQWMENRLIPEFVLICLNGASDTNDMQWYFDDNTIMMTSEKDGELRAYCNKMFHTSIEGNQISVIGHSRGATGALNFAMKYPFQFASVVSSAFVSDYYLDRLKQATDQNLDNVLKSRVDIQMLIGSEDSYVVNRDSKASSDISAYFKENNIPHTFTIIEGKTHSISELWEYPRNLDYLKFCAETWKEKVDE